MNDLRDFVESSGLSITEKAEAALRTAIGLAGAPGSCDDAYMSVGLRRINSAFAHVVDHFAVDLTDIDDALEEESDLKEHRVIELYLEKLLDEELRYLGGIEHYHSLIEDSPSTSDESESVKDLEDIDEFLDPTDLECPDILRMAVNYTKDEGRKKLETFDLIHATSEMPVVEAALLASNLSPQKLAQELARYRTLEPFSESQQFILTIEQGRIRLKTFSVLDGVTTEEKIVGEQQLVIQQAGPYCPFIGRDVIAAFEELINWPKISERDIHMFLEKHPQFLMREEYIQLHSELVLDRGDLGSLIPDFFAELPHDHLFDLMDLKLPSEPLVVGRPNRRGFSSAVNYAINQLREYRRYFDDPRRRSEFHYQYGLKAWHPKIAVIIGRNRSEAEYRELVLARRAVCDAEIVTYDDIIDRAKRRSLVVARR